MNQEELLRAYPELRGSGWMASIKDDGLRILTEALLLLMIADAIETGDVTELRKAADRLWSLSKTS